MSAQHRFLRPATLIRHDITKQFVDLATSVTDQGGAENQAYEEVQREIDRIFRAKRPSEVFEDPTLRRGRAGLGYVPRVLKGRSLHDKKPGTRSATQPGISKSFLGTLETCSEPQRVTR